MSFIGIISNKFNKIELENMLKKNFDNLEFITLKNDNIDNMRNVMFDILIINYEMKNIVQLKDIMKNSKYILVNCDVKIDSGLFDNIEAYVVTYGFNKKATIMVVSSDQDEIILDFQRNIKGINDINIESGEIKFLSKYPKKYFYEEIVCSIIKKIYG
ncbi:MAG: hypothetical protein IKF52_02925 [Clostridia bacterium]|nr:hypothetical protein [Clostridia bacterium]